MADAIPGTSGVTNPTIYSVTQNSKANNMSMQDFLMLVVAQMQNQDMNSSQDNGQFMAQMAQIASVQAMQELTASFMSSMSVGFLGKYVQAEATINTGEHVSKEGFVERVNFNGGDVMIFVDGVWFKANDVYQIANDVIPEETAAEK